jgi:hypothetical protein
MGYRAFLQVDQAASSHQAVLRDLGKRGEDPDLDRRLVAIVKKQLKIETSLYTFLQILSVSLFEKMPLYQALAVEESKGDTWQGTNQLELFVF